MKIKFLFPVVSLLCAHPVLAEAAPDLPCIDFTERGVPVKRLNGMCNTIPMKGNVNPDRTNRLTRLIRALEIPETRFHDVVAYNAGIQLVDVSRIFPLFRADENDPLNYDFRPTDLYLARARELGGELEFRFGEQIEHQAEQFQVQPPPDIEKWARICVNIARHYNDGWANGYRWNIRRFSVWEEPDNDRLLADASNNYERCYFKMYAAVARGIKGRWPEAQVGGPNSCAAGDSFGKFVRHCAAERLPLDFAAFTSYYRTTEGFFDQVRRARALLDEVGFAKTELEVSEWHRRPEDWEMGTRDFDRYMSDLTSVSAAAYHVAVLTQGQVEPVDRMFYYGMFVGGAWGVFSWGGRPYPVYYGLRDFAEAAHGAVRVPGPVQPAPGWYALATRGDDGSARLLLTAYGAKEGLRLKVRGATLSRATAIVEKGEPVPFSGFTFADGELRVPRPTEDAVYLFQPEPSLIVVRQEEHLELNREKFKAILDIHRRHPGSCDEFWMSDRDFFRTFADLTNHLEATEACRADFERAGVKIAFQQGYNLGHWFNGDIETFRAEYPKGAEIFIYDRNGKECEGFLCPRSPEVLDRERKYVELVMRTIRPVSYWIDDDLRLSFGGKPEGCYCERCVRAFNAKFGLKLTREELVRRIYSDEDREPLRAKWSEFNAESLAGYMAAAREGAERAGGKVLLGQESIWPEMTYSGRDYFPRLRALSNGGRHEVGIRAGAGWWQEDSPRGMVEKCLSVAREAERCRTAGFVATVCYEEENFRRIVLNKSPGAIVTEAALGLASGCDTVSLYFNDERIPEPIEEYERFAKAVAAARPYYEALSAASKRTRLAGLSRFVGSAAGERRGFDFRDGSELPWALAGVPISVMEAEYPLWYVNETSEREMTDADRAKLAKGAVVELPSRQLDRPTQAERLQLLDAIDRATKGAFPVRVDACRPLRILPRVAATGELDCVTLLNCSIGETDELKVRVRRPVGAKAVWMQPGRRPVALKYVPGEREGELTVPSLGGWQIGTVFFER